MKAILIALAIFFMTGVQAMAGGGHGYYGGHGGYGGGYGGHGYYGGGHHGWYSNYALGIGFGIGSLVGYACSPGYWGGYYAPPVVYAAPVVDAPAPVYYASPAVVERTVVVERPVVVNNYYYGSGNDHWKPHFSQPAQ